MEDVLQSKVAGDIDVEEVPDFQHLGYVEDFYASFEWSDGVWSMCTSLCESSVRPR